MKTTNSRDLWTACLSVILALTCCVPVQAQGLDAVYTTGKTYNIASGEWTFAHQPGVELTFGRFTAYGTLYYDRGGVFEKDFGLSWAREHKRLTVTVGGDIYRYTIGGFDWVWSSQVRFKIR